MGRDAKSWFHDALQKQSKVARGPLTDDTGSELVLCSVSFDYHLLAGSGRPDAAGPAALCCWSSSSLSDHVVLLPTYDYVRGACVLGV